MRYIGLVLLIKKAEQQRQNLITDKKDLNFFLGLFTFLYSRLRQFVIKMHIHMAVKKIKLIEIKLDLSFVCFHFKMIKQSNQSGP